MRAPYYGGIGQQVAEAQHYYLNNAILSDSHIHQTDLVGRARALICLALIVDGQTIGLLYIGRDSPFLPSDVRLAKAAVDVLASALHRMDLYQQTDRQLERMTALRAIDQSILSSLDLEKTLNVLLEKITRLLQVDGANFLLYYPDTLTLTTAAVWGVPSGPIWDARLAPDTHAGRVALQRQIDFISDLSQVDDDLTALLRELDEPHQAGETRQVGEPFASYVGVPLVAKGELKGVLQLFNHTRLEPDPDWMGFLEAMADQAAIAIDSALLFKEQQQANARLTHAYDDTIDGWSRALDLRDKETEGHSQRVTDLTLTLARRMGVDDTRLLHIRRGARLHDIGKMGVPDRILLKPGALTPEEWEIMRNHPVYALDLLYPIDFLQPALDIPFCHHEKWDGTGYPQGLQGEAIPLSARIFAVVDVWDALTSDRPYRPAWPREKALAYIREQSGKHFDPQVVEQFLAIVSAY